jgi:3-oxoacyl-[acyl-carrier protein] reductase
MKLQGKTALITGASRGIGRAIALELAQGGIKRLLLVARNASALAELATEIEKFKPQVEVITMPLDLTQAVAVNVTVAKAWRNYGPIHLLVNCAGVAYQSSFLDSKLPQVYEEFSLNLMGTFTITRLIARRMTSQREGIIVNVSSLMGKVGAPTMSTYSATKFALLGFTQALRGELAPYNVRVVALVPSLTDTDMARRLQLFRWIVPMTPQEVAQAFVRGLQKGRTEILVGWQSYLAVWCQRFAPWLLEKILYMAAPSSPQTRANYSQSGKLLKSYSNSLS